MLNLPPYLEPLEIAFGVHFLVDLTLVPEFAEKLYRQLTKENTDLFTTKFIQAGAPVAFIHELTQTNLTISETNFLYTEKKRFSQESFLKRCNLISRKLIEAFDSNDRNLRVVGKIFRYRVRHPDALSKLRDLVPDFADQPVHTLRLRLTLRQNERNVHLQLASLEKERQVLPEILFVECDINNSDQNVAHGFELIDETVGFADAYQSDKLIPMLAQKLKLSHQGA